MCFLTEENMTCSYNVCPAEAAVPPQMVAVLRVKQAACWCCSGARGSPERWGRLPLWPWEKKGLGCTMKHSFTGWKPGLLLLQNMESRLFCGINTAVNRQWVLIRRNIFCSYYFLLHFSKTVGFDSRTSAMMLWAVDWSRTAATLLCLLGYLFSKAIAKTSLEDTAAQGKKVNLMFLLACYGQVISVAALFSG